MRTVYLYQRRHSCTNILENSQTPVHLSPPHSSSSLLFLLLHHFKRKIQVLVPWLKLCVQYDYARLKVCITQVRLCVCVRSSTGTQAFVYIDPLACVEHHSVKLINHRQRRWWWRSCSSRLCCVSLNLHVLLAISQLLLSLSVSLFHVCLPGLRSRYRFSCPLVRPHLQSIHSLYKLSCSLEDADVILTSVSRIFPTKGLEKKTRSDRLKN